jgi:hypothetical protein
MFCFLCRSLADKKDYITTSKKMQALFLFFLIFLFLHFLTSRNPIITRKIGISGIFMLHSSKIMV